MTATPGRRATLIRREDFGEDWPFTVEEGELACEPPGAVTFTVNGKTYAVNGLARGWAERRGWIKEVDPIWVHDSDMSPMPKPAPSDPDWEPWMEKKEWEGGWREYPWRRNIGPIIQRGLKLCDELNDG